MEASETAERKVSAGGTPPDAINASAATSVSQQFDDEPDLWYVHDPEGEQGPLPTAQLIDLIQSGIVPAETLVRNGYSHQQCHAGALVAAAGVPLQSAAAVDIGAAQIQASAFARESVEFQSCVGAVAPQLSAAGRQLQADARSYARFLDSSGPAFATLAIIAINLVIFVLGGLNGVGWISGNAALLLDFGGNFAVATTAGQWWRLLSAMFLHSGLLHVAFNMWALWEAGRVAERLFGRGRYLALYVLAGVLGGIASINWQQDFVGVGASGAVFGVYGGLLAALLLRPDMLPGTVTKKLQTSATIFIAYSLVNGFTHAGIDNAAHLGGLLAGALVGAALVLPAGRAIAALAVTLVLIGGGAVRAIEAAEPYRDELAFRRFLDSFPQAEARLNAIATNLGARAKTMPPQEFLRVLEREVIPGWVEQDTRIAALPRVTPRNRPLRDDIARFVHLRREALELLGDAIRRDDAAGIEAFKKKTAEANAAMEQVKARVQQSGAGKRGKA